MKAFKILVHHGLVALHHIVAVFAFLLFSLLVCLFLFFVAVKTNPRSMERLIAGSVGRVADFAKVDTKGISAEIRGDNITILIKDFTRQTKSLGVSGHDVAIGFSLNDILHGSLYQITIKNFVVHITTGSKEGSKTQNDNGRRKITTVLYSLMPSVRVEIDDFILNFNGNEIHLSNSLLTFNQGGHILWVNTKSEEDMYKIYIALNSKILRIFFNNVPKSLFKAYAKNLLDGVYFDHVSGFVEFKTKNLSLFQFRTIFGDVSLTKSRFIPADIALKNVVLSGDSNETGKRILMPNIEFKQGKVSLDVGIGENGKHVFVKANDVTIDNLRPLIPWNVVKQTKFYGLASYLAKALQSGVVRDAMVDINLPIKKPEDVMVKVNFEKTNFEYSPKFAPIENGDGFVDVNSRHTVVLLEKGQIMGNDLKFMRVDVDHNDRVVNVNLDINGTMIGIANIFFPTKELDEYNSIINSTMEAKAGATLNLRCQDIFKCTSFDVIAKANGLKSFLSDYTASGFINVSKKVNHGIDTTLKLTNFKNKYFEIRDVVANVMLDLQKKLLEIDGNVVGSQKDRKILDVHAMKYTIDNGVRLKSLNSAKVMLGGNDFALAYEGSVWKLIGKKVSVASIKDLISHTKLQKAEKTQEKNKTPAELNADIHIQKMLFYNGIQTPFDFTIRLKNKEISTVFLDTDIIKFHYFTQNAFDKLAKGLKLKGMFLDIPNLGTLSKAFSEVSNPPVRTGNISITGERDGESGAVLWSGYLRNLDIKMKKITFNPRRVKINALYKNHIISFKNLKMQDKNHTMFFTGKVLTQDFTTQTRVFYTPSQIEFLNEIPFLKNAFKLTTLGGSKKGLVSLELDVNGSIVEPSVKFNKTSSVTSVGKFGLGVYGVILMTLFVI